MTEVAAADRPISEITFATMASTKQAIATFLATDPGLVTVLPSTSAGLFQVAFGLDGGNVVVPSHEFPANLYPWLRAERRDGPRVRMIDVPDYRVTPDALRSAVDGDTVAVALSFVDFMTGFRVDPSAIKEAIGDALLVVDAIQGLGAVSFPPGVADVVVSGGQKWLRSGWGSGLLAVSPRALDRLHPTLTGWFGVDEFMDFATPPMHPPRDTAERFLESSPAFYGAAALRAGLEVIALAGIDSIEATVVARSAALESVLRDAGAEVLAPWHNPSERAGIVSFRLPPEPAAITAARLEEAGFSVSERAGWIRLSPHASTPSESAARLGGVLRSG
jgi:selenocysteine lyase/cysteine desulfurase